MSIYDQQNPDSNPSEVPIAPDEFEKDPNIGVMQHVKEMRVGDGSVRIKDGALYITDETGIDRVVIGYLENKF